jgi:hypothetical protein
MSQEKTRAWIDGVRQGLAFVWEAFERSASDDVRPGDSGETVSLPKTPGADDCLLDHPHEGACVLGKGGP